MGQNPIPPVNIPISTTVGSKMGGAPTPKWNPIGFDPQLFKPQVFQHVQTGGPSPASSADSTSAGSRDVPLLSATCGSRGSRVLSEFSRDLG